MEPPLRMRVQMEGKPAHAPYCPDYSTPTHAFTLFGMERSTCCQIVSYTKEKVITQVICNDN